MVHYILFSHSHSRVNGSFTFLQSFKTYLIIYLTHGVRRCGAGGLDAEHARGVGGTQLAWGTPRSGEGCACHTRAEIAHGVRRCGAGGLNAGRARGVGHTRLTRGVPRG